MLVIQFNNHGVMCMMYIPKNKFPIHVKCSSPENVGNTRSYQFDTIKPVYGTIWISINVSYVCNRNFEAVFKCPEFIPALHFKKYCFVVYFDAHHKAIYI